MAPHGEYPQYSAYCYPSPDSEAQDGFTEGVNLYVSDGDLYNWKRLGLVFDANATGAHCLERPKVIRCPKTGKFVLWAKGFTPLNAKDPTAKWSNAKLAVVATADTPLGPFSLVPNPSKTAFCASCTGGTAMEDATLYVTKSSAEPWLFWRSPTNLPTNHTPYPDWQNGGLYAAKLNDECTAVADAAQITRIADIEHEAPAVFEAQGKLFVWTSSTSGFSANPAKLLVSESGAPSGPFRAAGNPTGNATSFDAQSTFILPNPAYMVAAATEAAGGGSKLAQFIYAADRWQINTTDFGRYLWLPLRVDAGTGTVSVSNPEAWQYAEEAELAVAAPPPPQACSFPNASLGQCKYLQPAPAGKASAAACAAAACALGAKGNAWCYQKSYRDSPCYIGAPPHPPPPPSPLLYNCSGAGNSGSCKLCGNYSAAGIGMGIGMASPTQPRHCVIGWTAVSNCSGACSGSLKHDDETDTGYVVDGAAPGDLPLGRWDKTISGMPSSQLPDAPTLGNGYLGVMLSDGPFDGLPVFNGVDLWLNTNAMWSCDNNTARDPGHAAPTKGGPLTKAVCSLIGLGGVSISAPAFGTATAAFSAEQRIANGQLYTKQTLESKIHPGRALGTLETLTYMHPTKNAVVTDVSATGALAGTALNVVLWVHQAGGRNASVGRNTTAGAGGALHASRAATATMSAASLVYKDPCSEFLT